MIRRTAFPVFALVIAVAAPVWAESPAPVDFGREVRPLLAEKCFICHGLDAAKRETSLRLDTKEGLFAELESGDGVAIMPGNADKSVVYRRLVHEDAEQRMPPAEGKPLTDAEIATIKRWIDEGAVWQEHWSFVAPTRPELPEVQDVVWPRSAIDRFVLKQLEGRQLAPSPQADAVTLLRRVTYDLTGLPPTLAEVDRFLTEARGGAAGAKLTTAEHGAPLPRLDQAYEAAVERLLNSPRYGEHMARYWLDAARYGDTHGLHLDNFREIWPYRDWVVRAFNQNKPFDQFTIEQLAGDLLPNPTRDQLIATGFNRCNVTTSEGGVIPEEYYVHYTNDRVSTMSTVWMGVSMGCVTCHEHKFDPFEMKDFYQLFAFFNSLDGPVMDGNKKDTAPVLRVASDQQQAELDELAGRIAELVKSMEAPQEQVDQAQ
ncbi:MAG: DUF1549 domain-containing protein, partial [Planctomycetales bacterium]|nr:DUF1549 domain-containing protein [Planctomycetales bacterium]